MTSTDLIVPGGDSQYPVLAMPEQEMRDLMAENFAPGETLGLRDLPRIKIPAGGATHWSIPTPEGDEPAKELRGVILKHTPRRVYWKTAFEERSSDDDGRPDCFSDDGLFGEGTPGGECAACPLNQFGPNGEAKPCSERRQLFLLPHGSLLPYVINITPGSLKPWREYTRGLFMTQRSPSHVETVLTLKQATNRANIDYAEVQFRTGEPLSPEARARFAAYTALIAPTLDRVTAADEQRDDTGDAAEAA